MSSFTLKSALALLLLLLSGTMASAQEKPDNATEEKPKPTETKVGGDTTAGDLSRGFSIALGARFSFLDNPSAKSNLYYDISGFFPNMLWKRKGKNGERVLGLDFGIYETGPASRNTKDDSTSTGDSSNHGYLVFNELGFASQLSQDSVTVVHRTYERHIASSSYPLSMGLYFSPTVRISDRFYLLGHLGYTQSSYKITLEDELVHADTSVMSLNDYGNATVYDSPPVSSFGASHVQWSDNSEVMVGVGCLLFIPISEGLIFRLKPVIGFEKNWYLDTGNTGIFEFEGSLWGSYLLDFRIIESKHLGIKFGGSIGGYFGKDFFRVNSPSLYLSKVFGLRKLVEFLKP